MASVEFATILALGAALLAGIGYVTLQRSARQVTAEEYVGHFTLFHLSLRHALWCWAAWPQSPVSPCRPLR